MRKHLLSFLLLLSILPSAFAQSNMAKLKYEDAEEAYAKTDYKSALTKLDEAEKIFGKTNPPIVYLRIMALNKLISDGNFSDFSLILMAKKNCSFYLKTYENNKTIEDKYREIYKISEKLNQLPATADDLNTQKKMADLVKQQEATVAKELTANKAAVTPVIEYGKVLTSQYQWQPGLTEAQFINYNTSINNYRWDRFDNNYVGRHVGMPLSVGGYSPEGPANYTLNSAGKVVTYMYNIKTAKNSMDACNKLFNDLVGPLSIMGKYVSTASSNTVRLCTLTIPYSAEQPDNTAYYIYYKIDYIEKWAMVRVMFSTIKL